MEKITFSGLGFLIIIMLLFSNVLADGGIYTITYGKDVWIPVDENMQVSAISYENGKENMIIAVRGELGKGSKAVWLFPIPAKPEKSKVDIVKEFPKFSGYEVKSKVGYEINDKMSYFLLSQIYPIYFFLFTFTTIGAAGGGAEFGKDIGIKIHEHLEKAGLTAELVTAKDEKRLYAYLKRKNLNLPSESLSLIKEYIGKDYSFVVVWVSNITKYKQETKENTLGIKVEFPTKDLYYPLKLTSIYGEKIIPITIYVYGHVTPKIYKEIRNETEVNYFGEEKEYTKIRISAKSNHFVKDLWISKFPPLKILFADFILFNPTLFLIIVFALLSCAASILSGLIIFRRSISLKKLALIGLSNFLTLIGFSIVTWIAIKDEKKKSAIYLLILWLIFLLLDIFVSKLPKNPFIFLILILILPVIIACAKEEKRFGFIFFFSIIFLVLTVGIYFSLTSSYPYISLSLSECRSAIEKWCMQCYQVNWSIPLKPSYYVKSCMEEEVLHEPLVRDEIPPISCEDAKEFCRPFIWLFGRKVNG